MFNMPGFLIWHLSSGHLRACSYMIFAKSSRCVVFGLADTGRYRTFSFDEWVCFAYGLLLRFDGLLSRFVSRVVRGKSYLLLVRLDLRELG